MSLRRLANYLAVLVVISIVWAFLLPPFFTNGACDAEFDRVALQLQQNQSAFFSSTAAQAYWNSVHADLRVISAAQCDKSKPRFLDRCGSGDLLYLRIPLQNGVCRFYRDKDIRIQMQYDERGRLKTEQSEMNPFRVLAIPFLAKKFYWGR